VTQVGLLLSGPSSNWEFTSSRDLFTSLNSEIPTSEHSGTRHCSQLSFRLSGFLFRNHSRWARVPPMENVCGILVRVLQTGYASCHPTNTVKALRETQSTDLRQGKFTDWSCSLLILTRAAIHGQHYGIPS